MGGLLRERGGRATEREVGGLLRERGGRATEGERWEGY